VRALVVRKPTGFDAIELVDVPTPEPGPGQVRIRVAAAAVNPVDLATATGFLTEKNLSAPRPQFGLGWDVAGTVDAAGDGVELAVGTAVVGLSDLLGRALKTHAEHVVLDADAVAVAPRNLDPVPASTFALNALTALQALAALDLAPGSTLLVTGAAGGVGGYAVELGKHRGLRVVGVAGDEDEELVRRQGAELFVPRSADLATTVRELVPGGVDGLIDAAVVGIGAQEAVRNGGAHAHVVAPGLPWTLRGISVHPIFVNANAKELGELVELVEAGVISTRVAETYPLADGRQAYERLAKGGVRGRLVLVS
jgi:NADPH:quinone reductase-like Zn-dependent oxidoreductase